MAEFLGGLFLLVVVGVLAVAALRSLARATWRGIGGGR
jgi:Tfp pilus assembly protein PilX